MHAHVRVLARWARRAGLVLALVLALAPARAVVASDGPASRPAIAVTDRGVIRGTQTAEGRQFLGVPYAAPPVGDLRWRPPQEHARWHGVLDTTAFGPHCAQTAGSFGLASTSEDCLFLNVFTPRGFSGAFPHRAPVMVWIHGGALVTGESDDYDPAPMVARGVVVVTINYRLGALGFLAHPALAAESARGISGNFGVQDQQAALGWVHRNIRAFGGDPENVTVFGESAGGLSVHTQLVSPLAAGLFQRAIVESGAYQLTQPSLAAAQAAGQAFAAAAGCADQTAACLRALPVATILARQTGGTDGLNVDGVVLPASIGAALRSGAFNRVPVMEGSNHDEWRLFVAATEAATHVPLSAAAYVPAIVATLRVPAAVAAAIAAQYPLSAFGSPSEALGAIGTDAIFACNAQTATTALSQRVRTFQYEFADPNAPMLFFPPLSFPTGAYHAAEIQYVFRIDVSPQPNPGLHGDQARLSDAMVTYWTNFARTGDPNLPALRTPVWPHADASQRFQSLVPGSPVTATGFGAEHQCAFWAAGA
jgi:para-nitrobenzyl esterase